MRADEQARAQRVAPGQDANDVLIGAAAEREGGELDEETERVELGGDVVPRGAVAGRGGGWVAHAFERLNVPAQPRDEIGGLSPSVGVSRRRGCLVALRPGRSPR